MHIFKNYLYLLFFLFFTLFLGCSTKENRINKKVQTRNTVSLPRVCFQPNTVPLDQALLRNNITVGTPIYIRIFKHERELELWGQKDKNYVLLKKYPICSYSGKLGPKLKSGDKQSPEGVYAITKKSLQPNSHYHLALNIQYPNRFDRNNHRTGDYIMIHGKCSSVGCFAMGNTQIEEIYKMAEASLKTKPFFYVAIYPFRMENKRLLTYQKNYWYPFWLNLKTGYDMFEQTHVPPFTGVKGDKYVFQKRGKDLNLTQN